MTSREVITGPLRKAVEHLRADRHRDLHPRGATSEEKAVLIWPGNGKSSVKKRRETPREISEGEKIFDISIGENAVAVVIIGPGIRVRAMIMLLGFIDSLDEVLIRYEEEAEEGRIWVTQSRREGDIGHNDVDMAFLGESKFLEEDHGARVLDESL